MRTALQIVLSLQRPRVHAAPRGRPTGRKPHPIPVETGIIAAPEPRPPAPMLTRRRHDRRPPDHRLPARFPSDPSLATPPCTVGRTANAPVGIHRGRAPNHKSPQLLKAYERLVSHEPSALPGRKQRNP